MDPNSENTLANSSRAAGKFFNRSSGTDVPRERTHKELLIVTFLSLFHSFTMTTTRDQNQDQVCVCACVCTFTVNTSLGPVLNLVLSPQVVHWSYDKDTL